MWPDKAVKSCASVAYNFSATTICPLLLTHPYINRGDASYANSLTDTLLFVNLCRIVICLFNHLLNHWFKSTTYKAKRILCRELLKTHYDPRVIRMTIQHSVNSLSQNKPGKEAPIKYNYHTATGTFTFLTETKQTALLSSTNWYLDLPGLLRFAFGIPSIKALVQCFSNVWVVT